MLGRQKSGSVVCTACGTLVGVNDERCYNCGRWNPGLWGWSPVVRRLGQDMGFVPLVWGACGLLYLATLAVAPEQIGTGGFLRMLSPSGQALFIFGASGAVPVFGYGRWWTVLSAPWLHGGLLHILFNMLWVRALAPGVAEIYGVGRMVLIYTTAGVLGFTASTLVGAFLPFLPGPLAGAGVTIGASGAVFGLLGALVHYSRRGGSQAVGQQAWTWAVVLFLFGLVMPGVDNWGHAGGFLGGFLAAHLLDPRRPERIDHLLAALVCLVASAAAVVASVLHALPLLG